MAKKFNAVKNGKTPGIFETWDECKKSVDGYSGAVFKSFKTKDEALAFLGIESSSNSEIPIDVDGSIASASSCVDGCIASDSSCATAYVDGSYNIATKEFGYGVVMFHNGEELHMSKTFSDADMASMRNVAGEIFGSMAAMEYAVNHGITNLSIYYDYMLIPNKQILLFPFDEEEYCTFNRDLAFDYKIYTPGIRIYSFEALLEIVESKKNLNIKEIKVIKKLFWKGRNESIIDRIINL